MTRSKTDFGISRRALLQGAAATVASAGLVSALPVLRAPARAQGKPRKLIVVLNAGGWDTTYALDPKPGLSGIDAPAGEVTMFGDLPIFTHATRPSVTDFFTRHAERVAVVHGLQVRSFVHPDCMKRLLTGSPSETTPDLAAIAAYELAPELPVPYLALGGQARSGQLAAITGRTGTTNQLSALVDPLASYPAKGGATFVPLPATGLVTNADEDAQIKKYLEASAERLRATRGQRGYNKRRIDDFVSSLDRAERLRAFAKQSGIGNRDYTLDLKIQIPLAVNALRDGLSHTVLLQTDNWDTHQNNAQQTAQHEMLFSAMTTLVNTLESEQMLDDTLVLVLSEMGRTPKLNNEQGKDHWPVTSAFLLGAGVRGGKVFGQSSDTLDALSVDFTTGAAKSDGQQLQAGNFVAGVLSTLGVDSSEYLPEVDAFKAFAS
jgi:uncharacterized protein (DUF1501 family)